MSVKYVKSAYYFVTVFMDDHVILSLYLLFITSPIVSPSNNVAKLQCFRETS